MLGKIIDTALDAIASLALKALVRRPPKKVLNELKSMLESEKYSLRSFDELLFKTAVYEHEPHKLVFILKHYMGANRYRSLEGTEMWGLPNRNSGGRQKIGSLYGSFGTKVVLFVVFLLGIALPILGNLASRSILTLLPPYECHQEGGTVLPGLCYPKEFSMELPYPVRVSMMINCEGDELFSKYDYAEKVCENYLTLKEGGKIGVTDHLGRGLFKSEKLAAKAGKLEWEDVRERYLKYRIWDLY
jgi:hypothetical protein